MSVGSTFEVLTLSQLIDLRDVAANGTIMSVIAYTQRALLPHIS